MGCPRSKSVRPHHQQAHCNPGHRPSGCDGSKWLPSGAAWPVSGLPGSWAGRTRYEPTPRPRRPGAPACRRLSGRWCLPPHRVPGRTGCRLPHQGGRTCRNARPGFLQRSHVGWRTAVPPAGGQVRDRPDDPFDGQVPHPRPWQEPQCGAIRSSTQRAASRPRPAWAQAWVIWVACQNRTSPAPPDPTSGGAGAAGSTHQQSGNRPPHRDAQQGGDLTGQELPNPGRPGRAAGDPLLGPSNNTVSSTRCRSHIAAIATT